MTEDEMTGWHHPHYGHEFEHVPGDGEGQGSLVCCSPWGCKELDMTQRLNNNNNILEELPLIFFFQGLEVILLLFKDISKLNRNDSFLIFNFLFKTKSSYF